jgi:hypothetical protein
VSVINRRNAVLGWVAWTVGKRAATYAAKDAAKGAKPAIHPKTKKPNKSAILLGVAAVIGALMFWKTTKRPGEAEEPQPEVSDTKVSDTVSQV